MLSSVVTSLEGAVGEIDEQRLRLRYNPADLIRWEGALRRLGPDLVRLRLDEGARPGAREDHAVLGLVAEAPYPPADFVEHWLRGQATKVVRMRTMLPALGAGVVLVFLSLFAWWTLSDVLQNPMLPAGTLPTINQVASGAPTMAQVHPPPGAPSSGMSPQAASQAAAAGGAGQIGQTAPVPVPGSINPATPSVAAGSAALTMGTPSN